MPERILVTGGFGYIGSVLVPELLQAGYRVRVLDNLMYGGVSLLGQFSNRDFEFREGDVRDAAVVLDASKDCDAIVHLAAIVGFPACRKNPALAREVNVGGTRNVAKAAQGRLVLYGSTGSNYGAIESGVCTEKSPLNPLSVYAQTKTEAERILMDEYPCIALRFATAFGVSPRLRLDLLVNDFVYTASKLRYLVVYERHFMRTFIHVRDIARSFLFALGVRHKMLQNVYNVGDDAMNFSKADVCEMIRREVEFYLHYADIDGDQDKRNYTVSYAKLRSVGFHTTITLTEGIRELARAIPCVTTLNPYLNA